MKNMAQTGSYKMKRYNIKINGIIEYKKYFTSSEECRHWCINHLDMSDDITWNVYPSDKE